MIDTHSTLLAETKIVYAPWSHAFSTTWMDQSSAREVAAVIASAADMTTDVDVLETWIAWNRDYKGALTRYCALENALYFRDATGIGWGVSKISASGRNRVKTKEGNGEQSDQCITLTRREPPLPPRTEQPDERPENRSIGRARSDKIVHDVAKLRLPTSTYALERLRVRQPSRRGVARAQARIETSWGSALVSGRLTEVHGLVLAAVMRGGRARMRDGGRVEVEFTLGDVCRTLGAPRGAWPMEILNDLFEAQIEIYTPACAGRGEIRERGRLLDRIAEERLPCAGAANLTGPQRGKRRRKHRTAAVPTRRVFRVVVGDLFMALWRADYCMYESDSDLRALYRMRSNVSRAVARFCRTHSKAENEGHGMTFLAVLLDAGRSPGVDPHRREQNARRKLRQALKADAEPLRALGFEVTEDKVVRAKTKDDPAKAKDQ